MCLPFSIHQIVFPKGKRADEWKVLSYCVGRTVSTQQVQPVKTARGCEGFSSGSQKIPQKLMKMYNSTSKGKHCFETVPQHFDVIWMNTAVLSEIFIFEVIFYGDDLPNQLPLLIQYLQGCAKKRLYTHRTYVDNHSQKQYYDPDLLQFVFNQSTRNQLNK